MNEYMGVVWSCAIYLWDDWDRAAAGGPKLPLFPYWDGHQPKSRGLYTHDEDSPLKGGMSVPPITRPVYPPFSEAF